MMKLDNIEIGQKIKSQLIAITCAGGEDDVTKKTSWKHWWTVIEIDNNYVKVQDSKNKIMFFEKETGRGVFPNTNHWVYKIK